MKIIVDIGHPAHVHFYKFFIQKMMDRQHDVLVTARDKDVTLHLLRTYGIEHTVVGRAGKGKFDLAREWVERDRKIYAIARKFHPDILTGIHNPCVAHVAKLTGAKSIVFTDTEHAKLASSVTFPFSDVICTPNCFKKELGRKQVRYNGYHELAYLHPDYFTPDPTVLNELGMKEDDKYFVLRFISWGASHDIGQHGFDLATKRKLVEELNKYGRVLISSETSLPEEFEKYRISLPPEKAHDLLHFASLYIGEGGTMATEAAVLGTPSVLINPLAKLVGIHEELRDKYKLQCFYSTIDEAQEDIVELLNDETIKVKWQKKKASLLNEKIDVPKFMIDFIENYPRNFYEYQEINGRML